MRSTVLKSVSPAGGGSTDREALLLQRIVLRDRKAFEELYVEYHRRLTRFLGRLTRRADLIDEVINEVLWIVWQKAAEFRGGSQVSTWIMGIAYRCTLKALRQGGVGDSSLDDDHHLSFEPQVAQEMQDWISHGLRRLPLEQRVTLQLAYYSGHSLEEISEIMECPVGTVKARMFHARVKLRNLLPALGGDRA